MSIVKDLFRYLVRRKKLILLPIILVLLLFGSLMIVAQSTAVGPFIYAIF